MREKNPPSNLFKTGLMLEQMVGMSWPKSPNVKRPIHYTVDNNANIYTAGIVINLCCKSFKHNFCPGQRSACSSLSRTALAWTGLSP